MWSKIYHKFFYYFNKFMNCMYHRKLGMSQSLAENPFQESPVFQCDADAPSSPFPPERDTPFQELTYHPPFPHFELNYHSSVKTTILRLSRQAKSVF